VSFSILVAALLAAPGSYDLLIRNGRVIDGAGNPWYAADVAVKDGRIAAVGRLDAGGLVVAPGFIDVHTHIEGGIVRQPTADNFLFDGVTSVVTGNCGGSETDLPKFFANLRQGGISLNVATLVGHNSVRRAVMGTEQRDPTPEEQAKMEALVEKAMRDGAVGFSTGLIYIPGTYSKTAEVVGLARAAARHGAIYTSHMRSEGEGVFAAIDEALQIGREAGMPVEISHFKVANKKLWGESDRTIARVEQARAQGLDVTVDQYPYTASSTNLGVMLPSWALADGEEKVRARLSDPATRKRIASEMKEGIRKRNGRKHLDYAVVAASRSDPSVEGKSITAITRERGRKPKLEQEIETVLDLVGKGGAQMVYHSMDERDVERILRFPYTMVASDAGVIEAGRGVPHPRGYGSNARVLGRYVRERHAISLEEAIRKMTSLPAQRFRLSERGLVRPGMWADLVVFDPATVADAATYERPHATSTGFRFVLVNGTVVIEDGRHTGARPGVVLTGPDTAAAERD
jgi:N-acyl-D-amino-acid deacylase